MLMIRGKLDRREMQEGMSSLLHARPSCAALTRYTLLKADLCSLTHIISGWPSLAHALPVLQTCDDTMS